MGKLSRHIVLAILAYEALGCLTGGIALIASPDGELMDMHTSILNGSFPNFFVPGIVLVALGILNGLAFIRASSTQKSSWPVVLTAYMAMLGWFWIEIAIIKQLHWLHAMWGGPVLIGSLLVLFAYPCSREAKRKVLLVCGILSSILYIVLNITILQQWPSYSPVSQTVSELSAIGAPTRTNWTILSAPYALLMLAFSIGILMSSGKMRGLKWTGNLLLLYSILGICWPFAPMNNRAVIAANGGDIHDVLHLALGTITEILYLVALLAASTTLGKRFQVFSWITFNLVLVFGALTFREASKLSNGLPTPLIGLWERLNIGIFLIWIMILAAILLRKPPSLQSEYQTKK